MATWTWGGIISCNRQGNQLTVELQVDGLGFLPAVSPSSVDPQKVRGVDTWRRSEQNLPPLYLVRSTSAENRLLATRILSITGTSSSCIVRILLRFSPSRLLSINSESTQPPSGAAPVMLGGFAAGFLILKQGGNSESSPALSTSPFPIDITSIVAAAGIGRLPRWDQSTGSPPLDLMCNAIAERVERAPPDDDLNIDPPVAISGWSNLSVTGGDLAADSGQEPKLSVPADQGLPLLLFNSSILKRTGNTNVAGNACAVGVVFRADAGSSAATQHLIGRWSGQSGTDNATTWQWRLAYDRTSGSTQTHTLKAQFASAGIPPSTSSLSADVAAPTSNTMLIYRVTTGTSPVAELWVNGARVADQNVFLPDYNTGGRNLLTVGARLNGSDAIADPFAGSIDGCFVWTDRMSDATLSLVMHEMGRHAGIPLGPPIPSNITQAYGQDNPTANRRLQRWPVAMINLLGASSSGNPMSQRNPWFNASSSAPEAAEFLRTEIRRVLAGCRDFEILFNRPSGQYNDDFISIGVFGDVDGLSGVKIIKDYQWEALETVYDEFGLSDHNNRDGVCAPGSAAYAHRAWFYTGSTAISDDGEPLQNGRSGSRIVAPCSAEFYKAEYLDRWSDKDTRFRCLFVDSAIKWQQKWVEVIHTSSVRSNYTLVGESIPSGTDARNAAPWFSLVGISGAPWWKNFFRNNGYNMQWSAGDWDSTPIYVGITPSANNAPGATLNLENVNVGDGREQDNLRFEDIYRFVDKGVAPVAWGGQYQKIGAAWMYGARRIPVGRYPMMSPRISRICR
ncbi:MAG: hypothetical protein KF838_13255 [Phycisphaeraceae bacterium]|nr:MAG: hypothetical protein KF838_13255 [Phycisphaeraceae bacterium]